MNSSRSLPANFTFPGPEPVIWICVAYVISFVGSVFFVLLLLTFLINRDVKNGSGMLLLHLTVVEFTLVGILFPVQNTFTFLGARGTPVEHLNCGLAVLVVVTTQHAGNWSSLFLSIMRFLASVLPYAYKEVTVRWKLLVLIILSWSISLSINLPIYFGYGGQFIRAMPFRDCAAQSSNRTGVYFPIWLTLGSYFPVAATTLVYITLFVRLRAQSAWVSPEDVSLDRLRQHGVIRRRLVITRMLCVFWLWYCLCYLPSTVAVVLFPLLTWRNQISLRLWAKILQLSGYAFSPVIFLALNADYQRGVQKIVSRLCGQSSQQSEASLLEMQQPWKKASHSRY
ncbi:hypothetical protein BV898_08607 [Hypsibius exemplaris]|uniref:G-protein coupled receptors family 1 profile domain-containing protein n=1 Tax=Hypsibius exemplaris TaxID=2072580 RepID=A0A1W0WQ79_HYPEX|nr:hypothetical protein BV898_08607 [Hypsibius exemplaris]